MSGCPFFSSKKSIKEPFTVVPKPSTADPSPTTIERQFSHPYFSPYKDLFFKFELTANKALIGIPFHLKNTLFHHDYVVKFRTAEISSRILMANELRESGNRNYNKKNYSKACLCYEHAYGLFNYCTKDGDKIKTIKYEETEDFEQSQGLIIQVLVNFSYALIALANFDQAEFLLNEATQIRETDQVKTAKIVSKLTNIETDLEVLLPLSIDLKNLKEKNSKNAELEKSFNQVVANTQRQKCEFWGRFFKEFSNEARTKPLSSFDLEFKVVASLSEKYEKMLDYYKDCDNFEAVLSERNEVQKVLLQMKEVKKASLEKKGEIMLAHAKAAGICLDSGGCWIRFEAAKRSLISKIFNEGRFNKRLLYQCIQASMSEHEIKEEIGDKTDLELMFWKRNLVACLVFALVAFYLSASPFRY